MLPTNYSASYSLFSYIRMFTTRAQINVYTYLCNLYSTHNKATPLLDFQFIHCFDQLASNLQREINDIPCSLYI